MDEYNNVRLQTTYVYIYIEVFLKHGNTCNALYLLVIAPE